MKQSRSNLKLDFSKAVRAGEEAQLIASRSYCLATALLLYAIMKSLLVMVMVSLLRMVGVRPLSAREG